MQRCNVATLEILLYLCRAKENTSSRPRDYFSKAKRILLPIY